MALIHNAIQYNIRLVEAFRRALGEAQASWGIERAGETLTPVMDLWTRPEWNLLRGEVLWGRRASSPSVAGELAYTAVINPSTSRQLVVVDRAVVRTANGASAVNVIVLDESEVIGITGDEPAIARDRRASTNVRPIRIVVGSSVAALATFIDVVQTDGANQMLELMLPPVVLQPGQAIATQHTSVAVGLVTSWRGSVRYALPGELQR